MCVMNDEDDMKWLESNEFVKETASATMDGTDWKKYIGGDLLVVYGCSDGWHCIVSCMESILYADAKTAKGAALEVARMWRDKAAERKGRLEAQIAALDGILEEDE